MHNYTFYSVTLVLSVLAVFFSKDVIDKKDQVTHFIHFTLSSG